MVHKMKPWWKSKTVWVNGLTAAVSAATYLSGVAFLPPAFAVYLTGIVVPVMNVVLRFLTKEAIVGGKTDER